VNDAGRLEHLAHAVARLDRMADLLPLFHQLAISAASGRCSVLLRLNPRSGELLADSAAGLDTLDADPWLAGDEQRSTAERAWAEHDLVIVPAGPELGGRLNTQFAVLAPLRARDRRLGLLVIGTNDEHAARTQRENISTIADMLSLALERARARREADLQQDLRELSANLTKAVASAVHLGATLEIFCDRAARLFAADRVSVWLHDRRARVLELIASSDAAEVATARRVATDDAAVPVSLVMREAEVTVVPHHADERAPDVLAPLRGRRRALGTLELTGVRIETGDAIDVLDRIEEVARHLSAAVENVALLEDLVRSRRELESTFDSLIDLVIVTDPRLRITYVNRAFLNRAGGDASHYKGRPLTDFFGREVVSWIQLTAVEGASPEPSEHEFTDEILQGAFSFTTSPLLGPDEERIGSVIVARDVTAQARLAAEGAALRSRLTQSEKLAALGQFVAGIAHELNNPLQGVLGHVELLLHNTTTPPPIRRDLRIVFREADRAAKIVHNLLVFAGSRRIKRRRLNVNHVVERVLNLRATAMAAASIDIVKSVAPRLPPVAGDALLLQQALLNIVLNAEQAMATTTSSRRLEVSTRAIDKEIVEIVIADTGPGIPSNVLPRLFEPFFTTKEVGQGTGLGLAIAYGIVQEHAGRLEARNRAQGGAVFTIALPAGSSKAVE
jgi:signal transduction histidine kinase/GAF domain-containing protein